MTIIEALERSKKTGESFKLPPWKGPLPWFSATLFAEELQSDEWTPVVVAENLVGAKKSVETIEEKA